MTPRMTPVHTPSEEVQELLRKTLPGPDGEPLNVFRTLAHLPQLLKRVNALGGYFMVHGGIPVRAREIVILRTAALTQSTYEAGQHRWIAAGVGLSPPEIEAALDPDSDHSWSPDDRYLLQFTDELVRTDTISEATWDALHRFDDAQRAELMVLVGFYRMLAGVLNGLAVDLDESVATLVAGS